VKNCVRCVLLVSVMILVVSGCAHLPGNRKSEATLRDRVTQEWEAKINGDWGIVYDLTTKEFKSKVKRDKYIGGKSLEVTSYEINEITIDPEQGKAWVKVGFDIKHMGKSFKGARTKEDWIWEDGKWRLNLKQKISPFH
jgi:hypothetical protein